MFVIITSNGTTPEQKPERTSKSKKLKKRLLELEDRVAQLELMILELKSEQTQGS